MNTTPQELATTRDRQRACIVCGAKKVRRIRGLCPKHHAAYLRELKRVPEEKRDEYDDLMVALGMAMPSRTKGTRTDDTDRYRELTDAFLALPDDPETRRTAREGFVSLHAKPDEKTK